MNKEVKKTKKNKSTINKNDLDLDIQFEKELTILIEKDDENKKTKKIFRSKSIKKETSDEEKESDIEEIENNDEIEIKQCLISGAHQKNENIFLECEKKESKSNLIDMKETKKDDKTNYLLKYVDEALKKYKLKELAELLNVAPGTITRWKELKDVPKNYEFDLLKLLSKKIDYSKYDSKTKDQFFTPEDTAKKCFEIFKKILKKNGDNDDEYIYIEPSAGDGSFIKALGEKKYIAFDIEPRHKNITEQDYLTWEPPKFKNGKYKNKYIVIGNPPFGLRGHLALKFINHSYDFADYVVFILPQLFESDGKGVPRKRVKGYNLIYSEKIESKFYEPLTNYKVSGEAPDNSLNSLGRPNKKEVDINTIFQIWSKHHKNDKLELNEIKNDNLTVYSLSDGGTPSSTRNKKMIGNCDVYIPSTCFGKDNMKCYDSFDKLPGKKGYGIVFHKNKTVLKKKFLNINWSEKAFLSTNSAYNLRSSQIYSLFN